MCMEADPATGGWGCGSQILRQGVYRARKFRLQSSEIFPNFQYHKLILYGINSHHIALLVQIFIIFRHLCFFHRIVALSMLFFSIFLWYWKLMLYMRLIACFTKIVT